MRIKLCDPSAAQYPFEFKIGDKVRFKRDSNTGVITSGDCYFAVPDHGYSIFYEINRSDGVHWIAQPGDIELLPKNYVAFRKRSW